MRRRRAFAAWLQTGEIAKRARASTSAPRSRPSRVVRAFTVLAATPGTSSDLGIANARPSRPFCLLFSSKIDHVRPSSGLAPSPGGVGVPPKRSKLCQMRCQNTLSGRVFAVPRSDGASGVTTTVVGARRPRTRRRCRRARAFRDHAGLRPRRRLTASRSRRASRERCPSR